MHRGANSVIASDGSDYATQMMHGWMLGIADAYARLHGAKASYEAFSMIADVAFNAATSDADLQVIGDAIRRAADRGSKDHQT